MTVLRCPSHLAPDPAGRTVLAGDALVLHRPGVAGRRAHAAQIEAAGEPTPGTILSCTAEYSITGGTGRFAGATGALHAENHVIFEGIEIAEWPAWESFAGWLDY